MAGAGTLNWAEEKIEETEEKFNKYVDRATEMGTSVHEEAGRENLSELNRQLDDVIDVLENYSTETAKTLKEKACDLNRRVLSAKFD